MKKVFTFKTLLVAVMAFFSLAANAQQEFSTSVTQKANGNWENEYATFKLSEVAAALGTDTATLAKEVNSDNCVANKMFQYYDGTQYTDAYNGEGAMFWIGRDGTLQNYAAGGVFFAGLECAAEYDVIDIFFGQFPDSLNNGGNFNLKFKVLYNGKEVNLNVNYIVTAKPQINKPSGLKGQLSIVGEAALSSSQKPNNTYATKSVSVNIADLAEKLGMDEDAVIESISDMIYATQYNTEYGLNTDTLQALSSYSDGWVGKTKTEAGDPSNVCAAHLYGDGCTMFLQNWEYSAETKDFTFTVGQFPGGFASGDTATVDIYICNGDKAYKVNYTLYGEVSTFDGDLTKMTPAGSVDLLWEMEPKNSYDTAAKSIDADAIAAALGCEKDAMSFYALESENKLSDNMTQSSSGYWLSKDGYICTWGDNSYYYVYIEDDYSALNLGQYPDKLAVGDTCRTHLYLVNLDNNSYYDLNITLAIIAPKVFDQTTWTIEGKKVGNIQQEVDATYAWSSNSFAISDDELVSLIGCTSENAALYVANYDSLVVDNNSLYTKDYTCTPYPGFWLSTDGHKEAWGNNTTWGISAGYTTTSGYTTFNCIQFPDATKDGDIFTGNFYLVNEDNGKMMQVTINYTIGAGDPTEEVGNINITVPVSTNDWSGTFDLAKVATAIGVEDILSGYYLRGMQANGKYSEAVAASNGLTFTADGSTAEQQNIGITFEEGKISTYSNTDIADDWKANGMICFEANTKRYVVNIKFMSNKLYDEYLAGIADLKADNANNGKIYTISGMQVKNPSHGLYIQNGKAFIVK